MQETSFYTLCFIQSLLTTALLSFEKYSVKNCDFFTFLTLFFENFSLKRCILFAPVAYFLEKGLICCWLFQNLTSLKIDDYSKPLLINWIACIVRVVHFSLCLKSKHESLNGYIFRKFWHVVRCFPPSPWGWGKRLMTISLIVHYG